MHFLKHILKTKETAVHEKKGAISHWNKAFARQISPPCWKQWLQITILPKRWQPNSSIPEEKWLLQPLVSTAGGLRLSHWTDHLLFFILYNMTFPAQPAKHHSGPWGENPHGSKFQNAIYPIGSLLFQILHPTLLYSPLGHNRTWQMLEFAMYKLWSPD